MRGRSKATLVLMDGEREELEAVALRSQTAHAPALRARIVMTCADGHDSQMVTMQLRVTPQIVSK